MNRVLARYLVTLVWVSLALTTTGCGDTDKVAPVSGVVKLDGTPLKSASVVFQPIVGGRPSFGVTDDQGHYSLAYSMQTGGAEVGTCEVRISTALEVGDTGKKAKELVPARYFKESLIKVEVKPQRNTIDLELTTQDSAAKK